MTAKQAIQLALQMGDGAINSIEDMTSAPMTPPGPYGGNHPTWIAGHLCVAEGRMHKMLFGTANPVEHWKPLFDWGSEPSSDASKYPPIAELIETFKTLRAKTYAHLETLSESDLDAPPKINAPAGLPFETVGKLMLVIGLHQCGHAGEVAVTRRAAGKQPFFVPNDELRAF